MTLSAARLQRQFWGSAFMMVAMAWSLLLLMLSLLHSSSLPLFSHDVATMQMAPMIFGQIEIYAYGLGKVAMQGDSLLHYFTQPEQFVLLGLQYGCWGMGGLMIVSGGRLLWLDHQAHRRHILIGVLIIALLCQSGLPFLWLNGLASPSHGVWQGGLLLIAAVWWRVRFIGRVARVATAPGLIAYASQTGHAMRLAQQLQASSKSGLDICCLSQLSPAHLAQYQQVLFVVSTHGQGEAPTKAQTFVRALEQVSSLSQTTVFSVLALGDRRYQSFCAFGHRLTHLLQAKGLAVAVETVEVDNMDMVTVNRWWQQVCATVLRKTAPALSSAVSEYQSMTVVDTCCLNPEQSQRLAYRIRLQATDFDYDVGDLVAVLPKVNRQNCLVRLAKLAWSEQQLVTYQGEQWVLIDLLLQLDWTDEVAASAQQLVEQLPPLRPRLYSIASCAATEVELLVRQHRRSDGSIGTASGYLCNLSIGDSVLMARREHLGFRMRQDVPLIMIAAGTGLAPFIGFLRQQQQSGRGDNWLFFGEQYAQHDAYFASEIAYWQQQGTLTHVHYAWSKDESCYVQDVLRQQAKMLRHWVKDRGAHIYLCGSQQGFGESVMNQLQCLFEADELADRLHTDLY